MTIFIEENLVEESFLLRPYVSGNDRDKLFYHNHYKYYNFGGVDETLILIPFLLVLLYTKDRMHQFYDFMRLIYNLCIFVRSLAKYM